MTISQRELAFYGGWSRRVLGAGVHKWGDPLRRVQEVVPAAACELLLPPDEHIAASGQRGVPYYVVNTGSDVCVVRAVDGGPTVVAVAAGVAAKVVLGSKWHGWTVSNPQFGTVQPRLVYEIPISQNAADVNVLQRLVAMGYDGSQAAAVIVTVESGVVVGSTSVTKRSLRSGTTIAGVSWFAGSRWLLRVSSGGIVGGWGGVGGNAGVPGAGGGGANGASGGNGYQAIRTEIPLIIECDGVIFGGGGGGGGGGSSSPGTTSKGGGGGGGVGCNMADASGALGGSAAGLGADSNPGTRGGSTLGGAGGIGTGGGGSGGIGGGRGLNGAAGGNATPSGGTGGAGGAGSPAISYLAAAGVPTVISGAPNIIGGYVAEGP